MPEKNQPHAEPPEDELWQEFEALDEEVQRIRSETVLPDASSDPELSDRLEALDKRIEEVKAKKEQHRARSSTVIGQDPASARQLGVGLTVAYTVLGVPLAFYGVGWLLDGGTGEQWRTNLTFVGAILGVTAAIFMLHRSQSRT